MRTDPEHLTFQFTIDGAWLRRCARTLAVASLAGLLLYPAWVWGGQASLPNTFSTGEVIRASDMNDNFAALEAAINDNDVRIGDLNALQTSANGDLVEAINEAAQATQGPQGPAGISTPIGGVIPWLKSLPGVPALPPEYVECNGQVLADPQSPLNGTTMPDLNGDQRFLRGAATSGTTGGSDSHTHIFTSGTADQVVGITGTANPGGPFVLGPDVNNNLSMLEVKGANSTESSLPPFYEVVWVIRVK